GGDGGSGGDGGRPTATPAAGDASGTAPTLPPPLRPEQWRTACLATVTTHDLPPTAARIAGDGTGWLELREELGLLREKPEAERAASRAETEDWLRYFSRLGLIEPGAGEEERITAAYRFLARTPARLVGLWLPDGVGDRRPQNVPGTWREYPNWRLPVADAQGRPVSLEGLTESERLRSLAAALREELAAHPAGRTDGAGAAGPADAAGPAGPAGPAAEDAGHAAGHPGGT
uniref:4-alpha-glucanotransferase n=1 Tax=Streptomyces sp. YIM 98790 TaxID=2689077 RepID=UPI001A9DF04D